VRRLSIARPFSQGYKSDFPDYAIASGEASFAQDMIAPLGNVRQRNGWTYSGGSVGSFDIGAVAKTNFSLTSNDVTVVSRLSNGNILTQDSPSGGTSIWSNPRSASTYWIPRCVYNGDLIFCAQDGESPIVRYAGATSTKTTTSATTAVTVNSGDMTFTTSGSFTATVGSFLNIRPATSTGNSKQASLSSRIIQTNGSTSFTSESIRNGSASNVTGVNMAVTVAPVGFSWPAVAISESGTLLTTGVADPTFTGTDFTSLNINTTDLQNDALLVDGVSGGPFEIADITTVNNSGKLTLSAAVSNAIGTRVRVLRRCPFKDATVHKGSLYGTGVKQYPNRVYVFPATKDIGLPPGAPLPKDIPYDAISRAGYASTTVPGYTTLNDHVAFSDGLDIPSRYDSTPIVALLSTSNQLLVLKPDSVYGILGTYVSPTNSSLEVAKISDGAGCIDLRSAVTYESVPYWAGAEGVYTWRDGAIVDMTAGKIRQEWQALMRGYVAGSFVTTGLVAGTYLVVSAGGLDDTKTGGAKVGPDTVNPSNRTFIYDLRNNVWLGRVSNFNPTHMWTTTIEDGGEGLLAVDGTSSGSAHQGRILNFYPAVSGGSPADADLVYPRFKAWSSAALAQAEGVEGETRFCDVMIHANLTDGSTPTSQIDVAVVSGGSLFESSNQTKNLTSIPADTTDRVDRFKRQVNRVGRLHQIRLDMSVTDSSNTNSEIPEIVMSFRDNRRGT